MAYPDNRIQLNTRLQDENLYNELDLPLDMGAIEFVLTQKNGMELNTLEE